MEIIKPKGFELQERLVEFAVSALNVVAQLGNDPVAYHLGRQLQRSGTSPALNYAEALAAESRKDFTHKLKICLKELRESSVCLRILTRISRVQPDIPIHSECSQLIAIITKSIKTATKNMSSAQ